MNFSGESDPGLSAVDMAMVEKLYVIGDFTWTAWIHRRRRSQQTTSRKER